MSMSRYQNAGKNRNTNIADASFENVEKFKVVPVQLVPRSGKLGLYMHSPIRLLGVVLNLLSTGTTVLLPYLCLRN
jgi:hypothetical protein